MASTMNTEEMLRYCSIPVDELENNPDSRVTIKIHDEKKQVFEHSAQIMIDELLANNAAGKPTRWVLPDGPVKQYDIFTEYVNRNRVSLKNLHVFMMDEWLDWNCRPYPMVEGSHSLAFDFQKHFYDRIDPELNVPASQRHRPLYNDLDSLDRAVEDLGGIDTVFGGLGFHGLTAFCEFPTSPWYTVSIEDYCQMKTRIFPVNFDSMLAYAQRSYGGLTHFMPPMALSIGFKSMLTAKRVVFISTTGAWKRTAIRVLMFNQPTVEYPATLFPGRVGEVMIICDRDTALPPVKEDYYKYCLENHRL